MNAEKYTEVNKKALKPCIDKWSESQNKFKESRSKIIEEIKKLEKFK
jgi:hypothetical protein